MPERATCVIVGGGGHARVLIDALEESASTHRLVIVDADVSRWGSRMFGIPIAGGDDCIASLKAAGATHFAVGLGGTADNAPRRRLYERALSAGLSPLTIVHPRAAVSRHAQVGRGVVVLAQAVINAGAIVGDNVIVNSGAIVEHDCRLGDHVHLASRACIAAGVTVGDGAHVGAGATVRGQIVVGAAAVIGAGAVVVKDVPPHQTVAGVPARPLARDTLVAPAR